MDNRTRRAEAGAQADRLVRSAITNIRRKQNEEALGKLYEALELDPDNVTALLWLAEATPDAKEKQRAVARALEIKPQNDPAKKMRAKLRGGCLTAWLIYGIIVNIVSGIVAIVAFVLTFLSESHNTFSFLPSLIADIVTLVGAIVAFFFWREIWNWKKRGVFGFAITVPIFSAVSFILLLLTLSLNPGVTGVNWVLFFLFLGEGLLGPLIIVTLIRSRWQLFQSNNPIEMAGSDKRIADAKERLVAKFEPQIEEKPRPQTTKSSGSALPHPQTPPRSAPRSASPAPKLRSFRLRGQSASDMTYAAKAGRPATSPGENPSISVPRRTKPGQNPDQSPGQPTPQVASADQADRPTVSPNEDLPTSQPAKSQNVQPSTMTSQPSGGGGWTSYSSGGDFSWSGCFWFLVIIGLGVALVAGKLKILWDPSPSDLGLGFTPTIGELYIQINPEPSENDLMRGAGKPVFGPTPGELPEYRTQTQTVRTQTRTVLVPIYYKFSEVERLRNFAVECRFYNSGSEWKYGFTTRLSSGSYDTMLAANDVWSHEWSNESLAAEHVATNIKLSRGPNLLKLIVKDRVGYLFVNHYPVAKLNFDENLGDGNVGIRAPGLSSSQSANKTTSYEGFAVWSLP